MAEIQATGKKYRILTDVQNKIWTVISFISKATDTIFNDGKSAEEKLGVIDGITSDLSGESETVAASIACVNQLNNSLGGLQFKQDTEGNWGYKPSGADTVFPFNKGSWVADWISCKIINTITDITPLSYDPNICSLSGTTLTINRSGTLILNSGLLAQISYATEFYIYVNNVLKISHSNSGTYSDNIFTEELSVDKGDNINIKIKSGKSGVEGGAVFIGMHF